MFAQTFNVRGGRVAPSKKAPQAEEEEDAAAVEADGASSSSSSKSRKTKNVPMILVPAPQPVKKSKRQAPQDAIDEFWAKFNSKTPGQGTSSSSRSIVGLKLISYV